MKFKDLQLPSNRSFGIFFSLVFLVASAYFLYLNLKIYSFISLFAALFFILILLINPNYLEHFNRVDVLDTYRETSKSYCFGFHIFWFLHSSISSKNFSAMNF